MRVIDLSHHVAGPFATLLMAELGHEVIKVERPDRGDPLRSYSARSGSVEFDFLNRRKRSVTLNWKSRRGRALLRRLLTDADAVVENFRPGTLERLGLSYRWMRRASREIVLTSISNFGQTGPRRDWEATEIVLQSTGGIVAATGWAEAEPLRLAGNVAQHIAGLNGAIATVAAVFAVTCGPRAGHPHRYFHSGGVRRPLGAPHIAVRSPWTGNGAREPFARQTGLPPHNER